MPSFDTIPPELRLQIYGELLRFDVPLKRTIRQEYPYIPWRSYRPTIIAGTAILCNTVCINHHDVCIEGDVAETSLSYDDRLVVKAKMIFHDDSCRPCFQTSLPSFMQRFDVDRYPKLETIFVEFAERNPGIDFYDTVNYLSHAGIKSWYTSVARLNVAMPAKAGSSGIDVSFRVSVTLEAWDYLASLPRDMLEEEGCSSQLESWGCPGVWQRPLMFWARVRAGLPVAEGNDRCLRRLNITTTDLQASEISSNTYKLMTEHLT
ncbi:hypothetical protein LTR97_002624 [Elasticomyces elasticus]|uniref:Uncharacterized protein n=1 Tax=Elasticomyces elasticus TaxID=574655 RepID=A0AAN8A5K3_9PEZI|nr:hypothetical protein LTR97_002624 [Elasticomyces elasticus]